MTPAATTDQHLRYPIGPVDYPASYTSFFVADALGVLRDLPGQLRDLVTPLSEADRQRTYRPGSWTVAQVVHHLADSHLNGYLRVKFALTVPGTTILAYPEAAWADLPDARQLDLEPSLRILEGVHQRLVQVLEPLSLAALEALSYHHPVNGPTSLPKFLCLYRWHSLHHLAHLRVALGLPVAPLPPPR